MTSRFTLVIDSTWNLPKMKTYKSEEWEQGLKYLSILKTAFKT